MLPWKAGLAPGPLVKLYKTVVGYTELEFTSQPSVSALHGHPGAQLAPLPSSKALPSCETEALSPLNTGSWALPKPLGGTAHLCPQGLLCVGPHCGCPPASAGFTRLDVLRVRAVSGSEVPFPLRAEWIPPCRWAT